MSNEQRQTITQGLKWFATLCIAVIGWFLIQSFNEMKDDIRQIKMELRDDVKEIKTDVARIDSRLIRVETKLEK